MTAAAPAPSETPTLPFPVPRTPAFDRPPGMRGSRLPHHPETIAVVRLLYERTTLRHRQIAEQAGVSRTSVHGWALAGGWKRPPGAPKSHQLGLNGLPAPRLKGRMLAKRLRELAEAYLEEMEKDFDTRDAEQCGIVLGFLKEAKLLEQPLSTYGGNLVSRLSNDRVHSRGERGCGTLLRASDHGVFKLANCSEKCLGFSDAAALFKFARNQRPRSVSL